MLFSSLFARMPAIKADIGLSEGEVGFALLCGAALISGYALLGSTWLIWKTEGALQAWAYSCATPLLLAVLVFVGVVSVWTPLADPTIAARSPPGSAAGP